MPMFGLGEKKIKERRYYPMVVSKEGTEEKMSPEDDQSVWDAFEKLSQDKQEVILSSEMPQKIKSLQEKVKLKDSVIGSVSLIVRELFFGEIQLTELEARIASMLTESGGGDPNQAKAIVEFIQKEILTIKPKVKVEEVSEEEKKQVVVTVKLPLLQALSKYEQLGNQLITRERIKIKSQSEPVRPSLLYWIKYYRDELGVGHHDSVQRGNFLFRSENGKRLSPEERERVNLVLKSVEENFPLEIDTEQSLVLFPTFVAPQAPRPVPQAVAPSRMAPLQNSASFHFGTTTMNTPKTAAPEQSGTLSFSSKHVLPAEKAQAIPQERTAPEPQNMPQRMAPRAPMPKANPFHIRPVSLGKEE